jgi:fructokinase
MAHLYGGIEAGGTKFICTVGGGPNDIRAEERIPTTTPEETLGRVIEFFSAQHERTPLWSIGIGCFGPIDLDLDSPTYGFITSTPKPGWRQVDVVGTLRRALDLPIAFETDVNVAALGEAAWGAGRGLKDILYVTVGTGIGGGALVGGRPVHGLVHPEMGHVRIPHDCAADPFPGCCPFHGDCLEGLASGPALAARWGAPGETLPPDHPAWALEAGYLAAALVNYIMVLSPQRIVLGGGVMNQPALLPLVRREVVRLLGGYVQAPAVLEQIDEYIVAPGLGNRSGMLGALALAHQPAGRALDV